MQNSKRNWTEKIEKFIKSFYNRVYSIVIYPVNRLRTLHHNIQQLDEASLRKRGRRNPYQLFTDWFLDVIQFGIICFIFYVAWFGWISWINTLLVILSLGVVPTIIIFLRRAILLGDQ